MACESTEVEVVQQQVRRRVGCVNTTSMGRLFDVVASLIGVRHRITYEGQAAVELEILAEQADEASPRWTFTVGADGLLDPLPVLSGIIDDVLAGIATSTIARSFHLAVVEMITSVAQQFADDAEHRRVALTGGVFQNALLARLARGSLRAAGFDVLTHRLVPPNDGGLSLGQAVIAGHRRR
jgi:hydrogenase maturation protein HypF